MPTPHQPTVRGLLKKNSRDIILRSALEDAWNAVKAARKPWWRRKTTVAELFWENAVENAISGFADDAGIVAVPQDDTVSFVVEDQVLLRVKKADLQLQTRNYPTPQAQLFHDHEVDLFGHPGLQRVEAVWVPDRFESELEYIGIVAKEKNNVLWQFELGAEEAEIIPFPATPAPVAPAAERVMKVKDGGTADDQTVEKKKDE
jgi:hypothetical protein